jgi:hypothetical protein
MPRSRENPDLDGILEVRTNAELRQGAMAYGCWAQLKEVAHPDGRGSISIYR